MDIIRIISLMNVRPGFTTFDAWDRWPIMDCILCFVAYPSADSVSPPVGGAPGQPTGSISVRLVLNIKLVVIVITELVTFSKVFCMRAYSLALRTRNGA